VSEEEVIELVPQAGDVAGAPGFGDEVADHLFLLDELSCCRAARLSWVAR
jgi:hypothetical protein